jgi:hypothetical protein
MDLDNMAESVRSRDDLAYFVAALRQDLQDNAEDWENTTLDCFLDSLARYLEAMDHIYANIRAGLVPEATIEVVHRTLGPEPPTAPSWRLLAHCLLAAKVYE